MGHDDRENAVSTTLSINAMVTKLQRKTGLGLSANDCIDFLNEAFRKVNQMSKGGFIWQLKTATIAVPAIEAPIALPSDFDPGKTAVLQGDGTTTFTNTLIPYVPMKDWVKEQNYRAVGQGYFSAWTFYPNFTYPTTYAYLMKLAPSSSFGNPATLFFSYHANNFAPITAGANNYFPTPDQFDSMIVDLAIAEVRNVYRASGDQTEIEQAVAAIAQLIDTYRTDRYDLAGLSDQAAQLQEKQTEKAK
jgi:hypothetical protein